MDISLSNVASSYFEKCYMKARESTSLRLFWAELGKFWNFYNYELFKHVVEVMFDKEDPLQKQVENYTKEVENFSSSTKVCDFLKVWPFNGMNRPQDADIIEMKKVTATVNKKWEDCTLLDVKKYSYIIAQTFFKSRDFFLPSGAGPGSLSITWYIPSLLAREIEKEIDEEIANILSENDVLSITIEDAQIYPLTSIKQCSLDLKRMYKAKFTISKISPKGEIMSFNLALIEKVQVWTGNDNYTMTTFRGDSDDVRYRKSPITLEDVGQSFDGSSARLILVEGAPGVGKTTFSRNVCLKWATNEQLSDTSMLSLIPLRDYNLKKAASLSELFGLIKPGAHESLVEELVASEGQGVTFWLDGWDEIASSLDGHSSVYEQLVSRTILPKARVIVTSRSWATVYIKEQLETQPSQHIEIVSSIQDQINRLIELKKQRLPRDFISLIDLVLKNVHSSPPIRDNMHTPLATEITLAVYKWSEKSNYPLPTTVTQLYKSYTCHRIHDYLENHPHFGPKRWRTNNFKDLPPPLNGWFISICGLAYNGLLDGQRLEFPDVPNHLKLETLGLMQAQSPLYGSEESAVVSYHFNHLTLQEFLCALLLSKMKEEERSEVVEEHVNNGHFLMVMRFLSGLMKSFPVSREQMKKMIHSGDEKLELTVFHWLFEGGDKDSISDIIGTKETKVKSHFLWSPLDYFVAGHCIAQSNCPWDIDFGDSCMGNEKLTQFFQAISSTTRSKEFNSAFVATMDLSGNELSYSLSHLQEIPPSFLHHLTSLDLSWNNLDGGAVGHLTNAIPHMPNLKVLNLTWNANIKPGGVASLALELCECQSLKELNLASTKIGTEDCKELAKLLSSTQSLETLNVSDNAIPATGIRMLSKGLQLNNTIETLDIHGNHISVRAMKVLSFYLQDNINCKLQQLDARYCNVTPEVAAEFAQGLSQNHSLEEVRLSYNPIGNEGAIALGQAIKVNETLTKISLVDCSIASAGGAALASSLIVHPTMKRLYLNTNSIGKSVRDFVPVLKHNKKLIILDIRNDNSISQADVNALVCSLAYNRVLKELRLPSKYETDCHSDNRVQWQ